MAENLGYLVRSIFPQCCGATILSGFGYNYDLKAKAAGYPSLKEIKDFLAVKELNIGTQSNGYGWHEMKNNVWHMAILSRRQKEALHDIFIEAGFELSSEGINGHSSQHNYLYIRKVN